MKPQALVVQKHANGTPISSAALRENDMEPSEMTQLTGGATRPLIIELPSFSSAISFRRGSRQCFLVESQRDGMSCAESVSVGGRPSGIAAKRKPGKPSRDLGPLDLRRRLWLYSVFTKVM